MDDYTVITYEVDDPVALVTVGLSESLEHPTAVPASSRAAAMAVVVWRMVPPRARACWWPGA